jgi:hypothetical protein
MEIPNTDISSFLKMIDSFYNNAWNRLTIILIIGGSIIVVVLPIIFKLISDYRTKIRVDKVENNLKEQFQNLSDENAKLIEKEMDKISEAIDKVISKKLNTVDIQINSVSGLVWATLGNLMEEKGLIKSSLDYNFNAFDDFFDGESEANLQNTIIIIKRLYKEIKNLSLLKEIENKHLNLIKKLNEINENSRYLHTINEMEEEFNSIKKRINKTKN